MTPRSFQSFRSAARKAAAVVAVSALAWAMVPLILTGIVTGGQILAGAGLQILAKEAALSTTVLAAEPGKDKPGKDKLAKVEADVDQNYAAVKHMTAKQFTDLQKTDSSTIVFDVREASEYQVSRIEGAERLDPGVWTWSFMRKHADRVKGKNVVFYCSVGVRSSKLAERFQKALMQNGAKGVYNLRGGLFRWHNDARPLSDAKGKTPLVHPYDKHWGKLLNRQNFVSFKPKKQ